MTWRYIKYLAAGMAALLMSACERGGIPDPAVAPKKVSIAYLKSLYIDTPVVVAKNICIEGKVTSSDRWGHFYHTLVVEDATGGIPVMVDMEDYGGEYPVGAMLTIKCNSLLLESYGGVIRLCTRNVGDPAYTSVPIPRQTFGALAARDPARDGREAPATLSLGDAAPRYISCFVSFRDVQFADEERFSSWGDPDADVDRHLVDREGRRLIVRVSRHFEHALWMLPPGSGYIEGILSYFNGSYQLVVIDGHCADMESPRF